MLYISYSTVKVRRVLYLALLLFTPFGGGLVRIFLFVFSLVHSVSECI